MVSTHRITSADELFRLGDSRRSELVDGELIDMPPPGESHSRSQIDIALLLEQHARSTGAGKAYTELSFVLSRDPDTVLVPDVAFVARDRVVRTERFFEGFPDLAVEILSPGNSRLEIRLKVSRYLEAGTSLVWVVDANAHSVTAYRPGQEPVEFAEDAELEAGDLLPGFRCRVAAFFE